jgi:hypothetical protein
MYFENKIILEHSFIHLTENRLTCLIKPFMIYSCPRMGFTRGEKIFLILRKNFREITLFGSFETPISVIKISVLIYCILKLTFSVQIWTWN